MTLTYSFRPYMLGFLAVCTAIPVIAFLFLLFKMSATDALLAASGLILVPCMGLYCLIRHWNDAYIFTATEVTYVACEKIVWTIPTSEIHVIRWGLSLSLRKRKASVPVNWITRTTFRDYLRRASES
ncbi:MAG: hypothetical protein ABI254_14280 [Chthoniobacterales bacterium]